MEIANLKVYNDNMRKSLLDKAYFLSFVDIVFLIQDNYSGKDIKDQIIEYEVQNLSPTVTSQIGDPEFLEE